MILVEAKSEEAHSLMRLAKRESEKSTSRFAMGAVITKGKRVLGRGFNSKRFHQTLGSGLYSCFHAESSAIHDAIRCRPVQSLRRSTILIYRRGNNLAKPCPDCQKLLKKFGIRKVIYSSKGL